MSFDNISMKARIIQNHFWMCVAPNLYAEKSISFDVTHGFCYVPIPNSINGGQKVHGGILTIQPYIYERIYRIINSNIDRLYRGWCTDSKSYITFQKTQKAYKLFISCLHLFTSSCTVNKSNIYRIKFWVLFELKSYEFLIVLLP